MSPEHWNLKGIGMTSQRTRDRMVLRLREQGITHDELLQTMSVLPRHIFVDDALSHRTYEDVSLPIGSNQTISQPWVVAKMTERLLQMPQRPKRLLEVGTGSGYQTALLAQLFDEIFTLERIGSFQVRAKARFDALELDNIHMLHGDGFLGWPESAPYDAIIVTAAPVDIPQSLIDQLRPGGCMLLPVGETYDQKLVQLTRTAQGYESEVLAPVRFVPLVEGVV
jgi:protein-L-isoaspartate(D-aspartate) O-methyltransferase